MNVQNPGPKWIYVIRAPVVSSGSVYMLGMCTKGVRDGIGTLGQTVRVIWEP